METLSRPLPPLDDDSWITAFVTPRDLPRRDTRPLGNTATPPEYWSEEPAVPYDTWDWLD